MNKATGGLPTLQQIRREHNITSRAVADEAGVEFRTEYLLEIGGAVERDDALKILRAFSALSGERCTVDTVGGLCIVAAPVVSDRAQGDRGQGDQRGQGDRKGRPYKETGLS